MITEDNIGKELHPKKVYRVLIETDQDIEKALLAEIAERDAEIARLKKELGESQKVK